jgi:hypothetical protein
VSMSEAFLRGLHGGTAPPTGPTPAKETATPEERLAEAVQLYDWQIRDLSGRVAGCKDPSEAARLHARITESRAKLDATSALLAKNGDPTAHPGFAQAVGQYVEAVHATLEDTTGVGLLVADIPPEHVERVLAAARASLGERLQAIAGGDPVNALDATH